MLIIGVLRNGLNLIGVSPFVQQVVIGLVIALAVASDTLQAAGNAKNFARTTGGTDRSELELFGRRRRSAANVLNGGNMLTIALLLRRRRAHSALASGSAAKEAKKLGLAVANLQANFFNQIKQSVEAYAKEKGIEVITVDAKGDRPTQVSQIQDL